MSRRWRTSDAASPRTPGHSCRPRSTRASFAAMKLATWNINSVRARQERVLAWLDANRPDVVCFQETKIEDDKFPVLDYRSRGYHVELCGQRTYNGVAILSTSALENVTRGLDDGDD